MAAGAMATENKRADVLANNMANADTNGYKRDRVVTGPFKEVLISIINDRDVLKNSIQSRGVLSIKEGERIRLETRGQFLVINTPRGKSYSTEAALEVNDEGFLITTGGNYVLGTEGRIRVGNMQDLHIDENGGVYSNGYPADRLRLHSAPGVIGTLNGGPVINSVAVSFEQGSLRETNRALDLAIKGEGFFCVRANGDERYTRDGSFLIDAEGYLSTSEGHRVVGDLGDVYIGQQDMDIDRNGEISVDDLFWDRLKLITFERPEELRKIGDNLYAAGGDNNYWYGIDGEVLQGFLETSNVNPIKEMVSMLAAFRTYEANQRVIAAYDEIIGKAVNEVGRV